MTTERPAASAILPPTDDVVPRLLRDLIHERTGIFFESDRLESMVQKLEPRVLARQCRTLLDYFYMLKYDADQEQEWRRVMDAFSVQETYFWREVDQIRALVDFLVPAWFGRTQRPLRIWSSACATGEEPVSLAIALQEAGWGAHPIEILGSDASEAALAKAEARLYRERSFRALPVELKEKYFEPRADGFLLRPEIARRVRFRWANLMRLEDLPEAQQMDVIFCRNVFIYFSPGSIRQVAAKFAHRLPTGGCLFLGASESLLRLTTQFDLEERGRAFVYVRNAQP